MPIASADRATDNEFSMFDFDDLSRRIAGRTALCVRSVGYASEQADHEIVEANVGGVMPFSSGFNTTAQVNHTRGGRA